MSERELRQLNLDELVALLLDMQAVIQEQRELILHLEEEVARLRKGGDPDVARREPPAFVKPNRKKPDDSQPRPPRKPRPHGFARRRAEPTRVVEHVPENCSECGRKLSGGWVHSSRQVLEIPVAPVEVVEHRFVAWQCGICGRREIARPDLSGAVLGQHRPGVGLMSLIAYLDTVCRLPVPSVQGVLKGLYRLHLSEGAIVGVLEAVAGAGRGTYEELLGEVRRSPAVQADETGARDDGVNGYVWSLSTPRTRYYHRDKSRGAHVIQQLPGA